MARVRAFGDGVLKAQGSQLIYEIPRLKTKVDSAAELEALKTDDALFVEVADVTCSEAHVRFTYQLDKSYVPVRRALKRHLIQRIIVCQGLLELERMQGTGFVTLIEPDNLYFNRFGQVKLLYRGMQGILPGDTIELFTKVKTVVLWLITGRDFSVDQGHDTVQEQDEFVNAILLASDFKGLRFALDRELAHQQAEFLTIHPKGRAKTKGFTVALCTVGGLIVGSGIGAAVLYKLEMPVIQQQMSAYQASANEKVQQAQQEANQAEDKEKAAEQAEQQAQNQANAAQKAAQASEAALKKQTH